VGCWARAVIAIAATNVSVTLADLRTPQYISPILTRRKHLFHGVLDRKAADVGSLLFTRCTAIRLGQGAGGIWCSIESTVVLKFW
jgi:hypothetical protein